MAIHGCIAALPALEIPVMSYCRIIMGKRSGYRYSVLVA